MKNKVLIILLLMSQIPLLAQSEYRVYWFGDNQCYGGFLDQNLSPIPLQTYSYRGGMEMMDLGSRRIMDIKDAPTVSIGVDEKTGKTLALYNGYGKLDVIPLHSVGEFVYEAENSRHTKAGDLFYIAPAITVAQKNATKKSVDLITESLSDGLYKQLSSKEAYKFDEFGNLASFTHIFVDGTILEHSNKELERVNSWGDSYKIKRGVSDYTYPSGLHIRIIEELNSDYYAAVTERPRLAESPINLCASLSVSGGLQSEIDSIYFASGVTVGDPNHCNNRTLKDQDNHYICVMALDRPIEFEDYTLTIDKDCIILRFKDGTMFKGECRADTNPKDGLTPPAICSEEVLDLMGTLTTRPYRPFYGVYPIKGEFFDKNGILYRIQESPNLWYDATSDGNVTEVYENGKPMPNGFARDRKILEYNGAIAKRIADLKAAEEYAKQKQAEEERLRQEEQARLNALYAKYGKSNIDKILNGTIPLGVSIRAFYDLQYRVVLDIDHGSSKHYTIGWNNSYGVWTENGIVTSVIYW